MKKVNFAKLPTEQANPQSRQIDRLPVRQILDLINKEDQTVPAAVQRVKSQTARAVNLIVRSLENGGRLFLAGAGTSGRLGIIEAAECPPTFNTPPGLIQAVMAGGPKAVFRSKEGAEDKGEAAFRIFRKKLRKTDVLIGIAASGVTPFVDGALRAAQVRKASSILIAANSKAPIKNRADVTIAPKVGAEVIAGSTRLKSGTATKLILNMLTVASMIRLGKVYENWMVDLQPKSKKLTARALRMIEHLGGVSSKKAHEYFKASHCRVKLAILMAKKGFSYSVANEKLKEASGFLKDALAS